MDAKIVDVVTVRTISNKSKNTVCDIFDDDIKAKYMNSSKSKVTFDGNPFSKEFNVKVTTSKQCDSIDFDACMDGDTLKAPLFVTSPSTLKVKNKVNGVITVIEALH